MGKSAAGRHPEGLYGDWQGELAIPGAPLQIRVHLRTEGSTLDVPGQLATGLPLAGVSEDGECVSFAVPGLPGAPVFTGTLAGSDITGELVQNGQRVPFALARDRDGAFLPFRPQTPHAPLPYREVEVTVDRGEDVRLAGTLSLPGSAHPLPAVLLITGSGSHDRDETLADHKPFQVLADSLARAGIAVLRVDDRGVGGSTGARGGADYAELTADVLACVDLLGERAEVDPARIGLLGHSEGGYLAPLAVRQAGPGRIAAVVLLATPGVPGLDVLRAQTVAILGAENVPQERITAELERIDSLAACLDTGDEQSAVALSLRKLTTEPAPDPQMRARAGAMVRSLWPLLAHDPVPSLRALTIPVLAVYGELDLQAPVEQNEPAMRAALAGQELAEVRVLPGLNHLMQPAHTGAPSEYARIETTVDPAALELITGWLAERLRAG